MRPHHQPFYEFAWSLAVAEEFCESLSRGTYRLARLCRRSYADTVRAGAHFLSTNQLRWRRFKKVVKILHDVDDDTFDTFVSYPEYNRFIRWLGTDNALDSVDTPW